MAKRDLLKWYGEDVKFSGRLPAFCNVGFPIVIRCENPKTSAAVMKCTVHLENPNGSLTKPCARAIVDKGKHPIKWIKR